MSNTPVFEEKNLTERQHLDPDRHLIGDALGVASLEDIADAGFEKQTGESPFPARSDHSHDTRMRKMSYDNAVNKACPGGNVTTDIDNLVALAGEEDWIPASTDIVWPVEGVYLVVYRVIIVRSVGTFPASTAREIILAANNGAANRPNSYNALPVGLDQEALMITERIGTDASAVNFNIRHRYINHDTVSHNLRIYGYATRLCSTANAVEA